MLKVIILLNQKKRISKFKKKYKYKNEENKTDEEKKNTIKRNI